MATVRPGHRTVLAVVDAQVGVLDGAWQAERVVDRIALAVQRARAQGVPVIWVQHSSDELPPDSAAWQWVPALVPAAGETRVHKRFNSAFEDTGLDAALAGFGATRLALAGAATNWCIRATAYGALDRGYDLLLVSDAHTTASMPLGDGRVVEAESMIDDLNTAMTWLEYPGRRTATARAEELDLRQPPGTT